MAQSQMSNNSTNFVFEPQRSHFERKASDVLINRTRKKPLPDQSKHPDNVKRYRNPREFVEQNRDLLKDIHALLLSEQTVEQPLRHSKSPLVSASQSSYSDSFTNAISQNNSVSETDRSLLNNINRLLSSRNQSQRHYENRVSQESFVEMDSGLSSDNGQASCSSHSQSSDEEVTVLTPSLDLMINEVGEQVSERGFSKNRVNAGYRVKQRCGSARIGCEKSDLLRHYVLPINVRYNRRPLLQSENCPSTQKYISPLNLEKEVNKDSRRISFSNELRYADNRTSDTKGHIRNTKNDPEDRNFESDGTVSTYNVSPEDIIRNNDTYSIYHENTALTNDTYCGSPENILRTNDTTDFPHMYDDDNELSQNTPEGMKNFNLTTHEKKSEGKMLFEEKQGGKKRRKKRPNNKVISDVKDTFSPAGESWSCESVGHTYAVNDGGENFVVNERKNQENNSIKNDKSKMKCVDQNRDRNTMVERNTKGEFCDQFQQNNTDKSTTDCSEKTQNKTAGSSNEDEFTHDKLACKSSVAEVVCKRSLTELDCKRKRLRQQMPNSKLHESSTTEVQNDQNNNRKMLVILLILLIIACLILTFGFVSLRTARLPLDDVNTNANNLLQQDYYDAENNEQYNEEKHVPREDNTQSKPSMELNNNHDISSVETDGMGDRIEVKQVSDNKMLPESLNRNHMVKPQKNNIATQRHKEKQENIHAPYLEIFNNDETIEERKNDPPLKQPKSYDKSSEETLNRYKKNVPQDIDTIGLDNLRNSDLKRKSVLKENCLKYPAKDAEIKTHKEMAEGFLNQKEEKDRIHNAEVLRNVIEDIMMDNLELYDKPSENEKERSQVNPGQSERFVNKNDGETRNVNGDLHQKQSCKYKTKEKPIEHSNEKNKNRIPNEDKERNEEKTTPQSYEHQKTKNTFKPNRNEKDFESNLKENLNMNQNTKKDNYDRVDQEKESCLSDDQEKRGGFMAKAKEKCGVLGMFFKKRCTDVTPSH